MADSKQVTPQYRYTRASFGPLATKPRHLDLTFDLTEERAVVTNITTFSHVGSEPLSQLSLDAKDLEIKKVELFKTNSVQLGETSAFVEHVAGLKDAVPLRFEEDKANFQLKIFFDEAMQPNSEFAIRLVTVARPTDHILEGIYYDYTPAGKPRTMITQCQQYGFQRITPCVDRMDAKPFYTTSIIADKRYSNVLTNGDLAPGFFDEKTGAPVFHPAPQTESESDDVKVERQLLKYHNHKVCMASYLFFLGVGTYVTYRRDLEYPDGLSFTIELLVFPGLVKRDHAVIAINALYDHIMWNYLAIGPEQHEHVEERKRLYALLDEREKLKAEQRPLVNSTEDEDVKATPLSAEKQARLAEIRAEAKELISVWKKTGYQYTGRIYREIAMQNSDYGGMENVGNTTILSSRLVPSDHLTDAGYIYMEGVKIHEYYHNINGSEVTGQSPFEIWLNEAVTVHVQREREDDIFGHDIMRLKQVLYALMPAVGPLAQDLSPNSKAVEPEGFNRTQELVSAMTYSKAPEFVRMVQMLLGKQFVKGLDHYYTVHRFGNATTADWIKSMEIASGRDLQRMARVWLKRTGYPQVTYTTAYDAEAKTFTLSVKQTGFESKSPAEPWIIPVDWALVKDGSVTHEGVFELEEAEGKVVIPNVAAKPDFLSFARDWSFFGTYENLSGSADELRLQALSDPDVINRYFAYRSVVDKEKARIVESLAQGNRDTAVDPAYPQLCGEILFGKNSLTPACRAMIAGEDEKITSRADLAHLYWELNDARLALYQAVYDELGPQILAHFEELESKNKPGSHKDGLHDRAMKHVLLAILVAGQRPAVLSTRKPNPVKMDVAALAKRLLFQSAFMSDKAVGLHTYLKLDAPDRMEVLARVRAEWAAHPDSTEQYIATLSSLDSDDAHEIIALLVEDKSIFNFALAGHARTLARGWSSVRKRSLLTDAGLKLLGDLFVRIGKVNQYSANDILSAFSDLPKFNDATRAKLLEALKSMQSRLDATKEESLFRQLDVLIKTNSK